MRKAKMRSASEIKTVRYGGKKEFIRLDMHIHSSFSPDSPSSLKDIAKRIHALGLDGFCLCDHDKMISSEELKNALKNSGAEEEMGVRINPDTPCENAFYAIGGGEFAFSSHHILGIFLDGIEDSEERGFSHMEEYTSFIRSHGGYTVLAHPYEQLPKGNEPRTDMKSFDFIEVFNSRADCKYSDSNKRAFKRVKDASLPFTAGSDAHFINEAGNAFTLISNPLSPLMPSYTMLKESLRETKPQTFMGVRSPRRNIPKSALFRANRNKSIKGMIRSALLYSFYAVCDIFSKQENNDE